MRPSINAVGRLRRPSRYVVTLLPYAYIHGIFVVPFDLVT